MRNLILLLFLFNSCISIAQKTDSTSHNLKIDTVVSIPQITDSMVFINTFKLPDCPFTIKNAINDIKTDSMKIVIYISFTGGDDIDTSRSKKFQEKYNIEFFHLGCTRFWNPAKEDTDGYNNKIFEHLTSKYGVIC